MTDLVEILNEGANEHSALGRVLRHVEDRPVCTHARDFYVALKFDPRIIVRVRADLPGGRSIPVDCRYRNGAVEFTHDHRDVGIVGSKQFVGDVSDAAEVEVILYHASQFDDEYQCPDCGALSANPESTHVASTNTVRVTCPDCGTVDEIPQGTEPPRNIVTDGGTSTGDIYYTEMQLFGHHGREPPAAETHPRLVDSHRPDFLGLRVRDGQYRRSSARNCHRYSRRGLSLGGEYFWRPINAGTDPREVE